MNDDWLLQYDGANEWQSGMVVRLIHHRTARILHSHGIADPNATAGLYEITAVTNGDLNDLWVVAEQDQPEYIAPDAKPTAALVQSPRESGWFVSAFQNHWFIALFLLCAAVAGGTWYFLDSTIVRIVERDLASTQSQLSTANVDLESAKKEGTELRRNAGLAETRITSLERQIAGVSKKRLTDDQATKMAMELSTAPKAKIGVVYHRGDSAGDALSGDIERLLRKAGFEIWSGYYDGYTPDFGLYLEMPETGSKGDLVKRLQAVFSAEGVVLQLRINEKIDTKEQDLIIHITN